jgi:hypothetical protein
VAPSSSAKKVAKLASKGKGKKVRFQGGSIFPIAVTLVVVRGLLAIVYGRQSRPADGSGLPRPSQDHWHAAFGIYVCDTFQPKITGTAEETLGTDADGNTIFKNAKFAATGIHSHGDGVIHYHPNSTKSSGNRAKLGVFLDVYGIKLTDTELVLPPDQGKDEKWSTKDTKCDGDKPVVAKLVVWNNFNDTESTDVVTDFRNARITKDGMVFVIAFVPKDAEVPKPDWAAQLPTLGAADSGAVTASSSTLVVQTGDSTPASGSTPTGSAPPGSAPTDSAPAPGTTLPTTATTAGG